MIDFASLYTAITGIAITASNTTLITAAIRRSQSILENMLGYTLDSTERNINYLPSETPTYAYRIFSYRKTDKYNHIDPATAVHHVKVLKNGIVTDTLAADEYSVVNDRGIIKYIVIHKSFCGCAPLYDCPHNNYELAVDADFVFADDAFPDDLMTVMSDMITYYADSKNDIKSETLGSHSYSRNLVGKAEDQAGNAKIIRRYAGPKGSVVKNNTF